MPICAYFLLCWLEFLIENKSWHWVRSLCLGLCFGIMFWAKYTLLYFVLVPMIIWLILNLKRHQYRTLIINLLCILAGIVIITTPVLIFYAVHHAVDDLFYVYFYVNVFAYSIHTSIASLLINIISAYRNFLHIGIAILFFIFIGIIMYFIQYKNKRSWLLLFTFLINLIFLFYLNQNHNHYFIQLFPYGILGATQILVFINSKTSINHITRIFTFSIFFCILLCVPHRVSTYEFISEKEDYPQLIIADIIHDYEETNNIRATLFCYQMPDCGFYNAAGIIPNNYYFAQNSITPENLPNMYNSFDKQIRDQTSDFVIVTDLTWITKNQFLSEYYQPYTGNIETSTFIQHGHQNPNITNGIVLLFKK